MACASLQSLAVTSDDEEVVAVGNSQLILELPLVREWDGMVLIYPNPRRIAAALQVIVSSVLPADGLKTSRWMNN